MKEIKIVHADTFSDEIRSEMKKMGVRAYSVIPELYGKGLSTEPKFNDHIWPGKNMMMIVVCDEESADKILARIDLLREGNPNEGIFAWVSDVTKMTEHKDTNRI